ncbi:malonyl-ACP O-methyltransferase BioC [Marinobacter sp. F3R11]|uniref:malonyl-ACP O-methyltransferase BioC n=1 Tax=Marinobacter sp. F3R11 TaxID=2267231 RepID=UPI000DE8FF13|nr:malonyl-ACP O-methyltransferase BioC [Marinobacter sp. F3R11]RBW48352.1 malonyl-[acyl-carrier protein] O-methyltransferase BioC [Marinobacter sp. F3R11]
MNVPNEVKHSPARKIDIARGFGKARSSYESASRLQRVTGDAMLEKLKNRVGADGLSGCVLDLGCGTGWFTRKLAEAGHDVSLTGMDLSAGMIRHASVCGIPGVAWVVADAEAIPLPDKSCDLIFSNLMIQWCAGPQRVLRECRRVLRPGGRIMLSTLLEGTLNELAKAWQKADPDHNHINRFESEAGFRNTVLKELAGAKIETRTLRLAYTSPLALAAELKQLGASYKGEGKRRTVTAPGRARAMCQHYPRESDGGIMASYEAAWVYWVCDGAED